VVGRPLNEMELIGRAKGGDLSAYESIVQENRHIAFRTAYLITGNAADAEEAAQDAFVKAHAALGRFRSGEPFRPWLLRIVANESRNRRRSAGRRARLSDRAAFEAAVSGDAAPSPDTAVLRAEELRELVGALSELREDDRLVIACRYFLDLSEEETAGALGVRRGTVKSRLSRALGRLRTEMGVSA
jgi:RNA polymerase sigma factor (sigma-70 family)